MGNFVHFWGIMPIYGHIVFVNPDKNCIQVFLI